MSCDTPGCRSSTDERFWTPTGIRWLCVDCADWMGSVYENAGIEYRREPASEA